MFPAPKHLRDIAKPIDIPEAEDDDTGFEARLVCPCGSEEFLLMHAGGFIGKGKFRDIGYAERGGENFLLIKARCASCSVEHMIFDDDYHGWNGYVCGVEEGLRERTRPDLVPWECSNCGCMAHKAMISLTSEGKDDALSEGEGVLTEDDWFEAFGAIVMDIECVTCNFKRGGWLNLETM